MQISRLKNGLRYVAIPRKETGAVTVLVGIGAGSRHETDELAGVSHFVEHMNFKGTKKRPTPLEVAEYIENIGGITNAYTSKEHTAYYVKIASEHLREALEFLSDNLINSLNLPDEFEREKGVVIEDLKMHKDRPMEEVAELFEEKLFIDKALARRIGGTPESVSNITLDGLKNYKNKHYVANNIVVAIVGKYDTNKLGNIEDLVQTYFTFATGGNESLSKFGENKSTVVVCDDRKIEQTNLILGFAGPGSRDSKKYAAKIMAMILGGSMSSHMFTEIREKRGLAYAIHTSHSGYSDTGMIFTQAGIANENLAETIKAIMVEYKKIVNEKVTEAELKRAKEIIRGGLMISLEDSENLADMLVTQELTQDKITTPSQAIEQFMRVGLEDVLKISQEYLNLDKMVVSVVGPGAKEERVWDILKTE